MGSAGQVKSIDIQLAALIVDLCWVFFAAYLEKCVICNAVGVGAAEKQQSVFHTND